MRRTPLKQEAEHFRVGQPEKVVREHRVGAGERHVGLKAHRLDRGEEACAVACGEHVLQHEGVGHARHLDAAHVDGRAVGDEGKERRGRKEGEGKVDERARRRCVRLFLISQDAHARQIKKCVSTSRTEA
jgi:hypothetical protein